MTTPPRLRVGSSTGYMGSIADRDPTSPQSIASTLTDTLAAMDRFDFVGDRHDFDIDSQLRADGRDEVSSSLSLSLPLHNGWNPGLTPGFDFR